MFPARSSNAVCLCQVPAFPRKALAKPYTPQARPPSCQRCYPCRSALKLRLGLSNVLGLIRSLARVRLLCSSA